MKKLFFLMAASFLFAPVHAQITECERPAEWQHLVKGARFMDRFLPMPDGIQVKGIWGTDSVLNRYVDNGIELPGVSFWGGIYCRIRKANIICLCVAGPRTLRKVTCSGQTLPFFMR